MFDKFRFKWIYNILPKFNGIKLLGKKYTHTKIKNLTVISHEFQRKIVIFLNGLFLFFSTKHCRNLLFKDIVAFKAEAASRK